MTSDFIVDAAGRIVPRSLGSLALGPQNFSLAPPGFQLPSRSLVPSPLRLPPPIAGNFQLGPGTPPVSPLRPVAPAPLRLEAPNVVNTAATPTGGIDPVKPRGGRIVSALKKVPGALARGVIPTVGLAGIQSITEEGTREQATSGNTLFFPSELRGKVFDIGAKLDISARDPSLSPLDQTISRILSDIITSPLDFDVGIEKIKAGPGGFIPDPIAKPFLELTRPVEETQALIAAEERVQDLQVKLRKQQKAESDQATIDTATALGLLPSLNTGGGEFITAFESPIAKPPELPEFTPTPPAADYTETLAALEKARPDPVAENDNEQKKTMGVLAGFASGLLSAPDDESFGKTLLRFGLGGFEGGQAAQADIDRAEKEFKVEMDKYWRSVASVKQRKAESNADYALRAAEIDRDNTILRYNRDSELWKNSQPKFQQLADGKFGITETVTDELGNRTLRQRVWAPNDAVNNLTRTRKHLSKFMGKDELEVAMFRINSSQNPTLQSAGEGALASARANGTEEALISFFGLQEELNKIGQLIQVELGTSIASKAERILNAKTAFMVQFLIAEPQNLLLAQEFISRGIRSREAGLDVR